MSARLKSYLLESYGSRRFIPSSLKNDPKFPIQIDDQDDNDNINDFCNIFCIVCEKERFIIELAGNFPISDAISDLVEIYNGTINRDEGRISLVLNTRQIEALTDLADRIRKTSLLGHTVNNGNWLAVSARTISSLYRFVRTIKEFNLTQAGQNILLN